MRKGLKPKKPTLEQRIQALEARVTQLEAQLRLTRAPRWPPYDFPRRPWPDPGLSLIGYVDLTNIRQPKEE